MTDYVPLEVALNVIGASLFQGWPRAEAFDEPVPFDRSPGDKKRALAERMMLDETRTVLKYAVRIRRVRCVILDSNTGQLHEINRNAIEDDNDSPFDLLLAGTEHSTQALQRIVNRSVRVGASGKLLFHNDDLKRLEPYRPLSSKSSDRVTESETIAESRPFDPNCFDDRLAVLEKSLYMLFTDDTMKQVAELPPALIETQSDVDADLGDRNIEWNTRERNNVFWFMSYLLEKAKVDTSNPYKLGQSIALELGGALSAETIAKYIQKATEASQSSRPRKNRP